MKKSYFYSIFVCAFVLCLSALSFAEDNSNNEEKWPMIIFNDKGEVTVYQPQLDSLDKNVITARAAISVKLNDKNEPIFGAIWITANFDSDRDNGMIEFKNIKVEKVKFADDIKGDFDNLKSIIEDSLSSKKMEISIERLNAMLELVKKEEEKQKQFATEPPEIIITTNPTVLVLIDGKPKLKKTDDKRLMRVINTSFTILLDEESKKYFLGKGDNWATSDDVLSGWQPTKEVPDYVKKFNPASKDDEEENEKKTDVLPTIIVKTEPAELVVINGQAEFSPIEGTDLLYVENTEGNIFMEVGEQKIYLLISGRWYVSSNPKGPWKYLPSDKLPEDFSKIPPNSEKGNVLASVAGTEQAKDAVLDTYIPQTATISRDDTNIVVQFDGEPDFEKIEDTDLKYAVNTPDQVILCDGKYYCCQNGVWYVADKLITTAGKIVNGAVEAVSDTAETALRLSLGTLWNVCADVPDQIYEIPPSSPVYPATYCNVYDSTPEVVYAGYTPGYVGCYRYNGCVVYGTGYPYRPWCGNYYWPRPCTFGLSVGYNPATGWNIGVGFGIGFGIYGGMNFYWNSGGWYNDRREDWQNYRNQRWQNYQNRKNQLKNKKEQNLYNDRKPIKDKISKDELRDKIKNSEKLKNLSPEQKQKLKDRVQSGEKLKNLSPTQKDNLRAKLKSEGKLQDLTARQKQDLRSRASSKRNNLVTDKNGNVYRKDLSGWQKRENNGWNRIPQSSKNAAQIQRNLDRQYTARKRGEVRTRQARQSYSRPRRSPSRSSYSRPRTRPSSSRMRTSRPTRSRPSGGRARRSGGGARRSGGGRRR